MPTDFAFRLSTYLTLALGCLCLGYAEWDYLREASAFTAVVGLLVGAAFWADRRGFELSLRAANRLGFGLFLVAVGWIGVHYARSDSLIHTLPWPAGLLPFVGPILLLAMAAKLLRPKHAGDWWLLQGIGLVTVGLAASLCDDAGLVLILFAYILTGVWSLTLFYVRRASGYVPPVPPPEPRSVGYYFPWLSGGGNPRPTVAESFAGVGLPTPTERLGRSHFFRSIRWLAGGAAVALPAFFLTPRSQGLEWELFKSRMETGLPEGGVDLSRIGELRANPEPAFEVTATYPDGRPKDDLPADQRWRVATYVDYVYPRGRWNRGAGLRVYAPPPGVPRLWTDVTPRPEFPDLGPGQFVLAFDLTRKVPGLALLDPVAFVPGGRPPVVYPVRTGGYAYGIQGPDLAFLSQRREGGRLTKYLQAAAVPADPNRGTPFPAGPDAHREPLSAPLPTTRVKDWTYKLVDRLTADGKLPAAVRVRRNPYTLAPAEEDHAAVAAALRDYLAESGEYEYTLDLRRQDKGIDPVEDFLFLTKAGHCERFAAGLVLMLRSVGIPAQFVVGYKGCESLGDGKYVVRQEHAHAWAEALVWRPAARPLPGTDGRDWYWLTLDPTPGDATAGGTQDGGLLATGQKEGRRILSELIIGLTPETQRKLAAAAREFAVDNGPPVGLGVAALAAVVVAGWVAYRRLARRPPPSAASGVDPVPWFTRLVDVLTRHGHPPPGGRTPREYAAAAADSLRADPHTASVADVPGAVADLLYRQRYAGRPVTPDELARAEAAVARLEAALTG